MPDLLQLDGRVVLITGAGQGIGRVAALMMAQHGARLVVNDYHPERAEAVAAEVERGGGVALAVAGDVSDLGSVRAVVAAAETRFGRVDVLVNNAGNAGPAVIDESSTKPFWETGPQDWARWMATNFYGVLNCCHAVVPGMLARKSGRIITMVSDAGRVGEPHLAVYSGAKAGAAGFMRGLARAVAHAGVTANCIALGATRTPGIESMLADPENVKRMLRGYLIRRLGEPADAAAMILFLASDAGSWITGQTYPVNGGYSLAA